VTIDDMTTSVLRIERVGFAEPVARQLVAQALADLGARYGGEGDETPVAAADFEPPNGAFLVAYRGETPVGCGAWRSHGDGTAELKRMYTVPAARGTGVATAVLAAIEADARRAGRTRVILETGGKQPEAIALYGKLGYRRIPNYGYYADEPDCLSFARDL
jgi:GNAT superfamily N-acetyltransferase